MSHEGQQLATPVTGAHDIEQVLLGLADGSYILSTPEGAVAECGAGVVALLGVPADRLAGRPTADALVPGADAGTRAAFEGLLQAEGAGGSTAVFRIPTAAGLVRSLEFVVVAVPLALGWEFTSLLSELGSRDAGTWHPEALRLRHGRALEAIEGVCESGAQPDPGARLAGILIVVRDIDAPLLTREDVGRRMAEHREAARAAAAEAARRADAATGRRPIDTDPSVEAAGLEDVIDAARVLRERVGEAEREAEEARAAAQRAQAELAEVRLQLDVARGESTLTRDQLDEMQAELDRAAAAVEAAQRERAVAQGEELAGALAERDALRAELVTAREQLEALRAALESSRTDLGSSRAELESTRTQLEGARAELEGTRAELDGIRAQLEGTRAELDGTRAQLEGTRAELTATLAAAEDAEVEREQARLRANALLDQAEVARAAAEAIRAEFAIDTPQRPAPAAAPAAAAPNLALPPAGPGEALALIGLDGTFKRLDDAFCGLLGCAEEDLRSARWPSIIDRENLAAHQEIARALRAGEIRGAPVETVYMHAQGLLVPIAGTVTMHSADGGEPTHFLFRADVSRTSG